MISALALVLMSPLALEGGDLLMLAAVPFIMGLAVVVLRDKEPYLGEQPWADRTPERETPYRELTSGSIAPGLVTAGNSDEPVERYAPSDVADDSVHRHGGSVGPAKDDVVVVRADADRLPGDVLLDPGVRREGGERTCACEGVEGDEPRMGPK